MKRSIVGLALIAGCNAKDLDPTASSNEARSTRSATPIAAETTKTKSDFALEASTITNDAAPKISWSAVPGATGFLLKVSLKNDCDEAIFLAKITNTNAVLDSLRDGTYFICLYSIDKAGALTAASNNNQQMTIDRTPPKVSLQATVIDDHTTKIMSTMSDLSAVTYKWQISPAGQATLSDEKASSLTVTAINAGDQVVTLIATDAAQNATTTTTTLTFGPWIHLPAHVPASLSCLDSDPLAHVIGGSAIIGKAVDESDVSGYKLYWGTSATAKLTASPIANFTKTGANLTYLWPAASAIPTGASHLLVYSINADGESASGASCLITDVGVPAQAASNVAFSDTDYAGGFLAGNILITKAASEADLTSYAVYWGSDATTKLAATASTPVTVISKTGSDLTYSFPSSTAIPTGATHLLVRSRNVDGEQATGPSVAIVDRGVPEHAAAALSFTDSDLDGGQLIGSLAITKAADESDLTDYRVYWGTNATTKQSSTPLTTLTKTGSNLSYAMTTATAIPTGATYFLVYSHNADGEMGTPTSLAIVDLGVPVHAAASASFTDSDLVDQQIAGDLVATPASNESDVTHYVFYWGSSATVKLSATPIQTLSKATAPLTVTFALHTPVPTGATHFLIFTKNADGEMGTPYAQPIQDHAKFLYAYTGSAQSFTVPSTVSSVSIKAWGAGGGYSSHRGETGGGGGFATGSVTVTAGETLSIIVGGGGQSSNRGSAGGGRSSLQRASADLLTAAGGAGAGCIWSGGAGGGLTGQDGVGNHSSGLGASATAGGAGGTGGAGNGDDGQQYLGGQGSQANGAGPVATFGGGGRGGECTGGGGGGYFGGGGGGRDGGNDGGGGGGSSFVPSGGSTTAGTLYTPGNTSDADFSSTLSYGGRSGINSGYGYNGYVVLQY